MILNSKENKYYIHLFVRKNKDDKISNEFYYLGLIEPYGQCKEFVMEGTNKSAVEIYYRLDVAVRRDIYDYFMVE